MLLIGIDPGIGGALVAMRITGEVLNVWDCPRALERTTSNHGYAIQEIHRLVASLACVEAAMEQVQGLPGDAGAGAFSFGFGFALWQAALAMHNIPTRFCDSRRWRKEIGMEIVKGRNEHKKAALETARRVWPRQAPLLQRAKDDGRAEALLICEWLRRKVWWEKYHRGEMPAPDFKDVSPYASKGGRDLKLMERMRKIREETGT